MVFHPGKEVFYRLGVDQGYLIGAPIQPGQSDRDRVTGVNFIAQHEGRSVGPYATMRYILEKASERLNEKTYRGVIDITGQALIPMKMSWGSAGNIEFTEDILVVGRIIDGRPEVFEHGLLRKSPILVNAHAYLWRKDVIGYDRRIGHYIDHILPEIDETGCYSTMVLREVTTPAKR